ncbi:hypothetical protein SAMN05192559_105154 [Halobacillus karajensis]|uniref:Gamma-type small acid-soluble spore protein n=1 Tax=Halobacillus karajensis TaxID=195088 RepID=A0A024P6H3_9BACI|nr:hypothetical protein [Halobacillus karajensis]CDQ20579.1 hypothetical protein BN982_02927 [Halobacillus karajensis]CDQ23952.1 hypothetical protein BN983_02210 [Halobacillus karajensis]CDQ27430.1 hypothetical protein BN981_01691 [Halobacillus karajensis]SEH89385.1 hypothetical protein SAMN05192559_105154 [Halobacillus karajensis]
MGKVHNSFNQGNGDVYSSSGTNISEVKRRNDQSGLSYNQVKEMLAKSNRTNK